MRSERSAGGGGQRRGRGRKRNEEAKIWRKERAVNETRGEGEF